MKKITIIALFAALLPFFGIAQTTCTDTAYTVQSGGLFFSVQLKTCADGSEYYSRTPLSDTTAVINAVANQIQVAANEAAQASAIASRMRQQTTDWAKLDTITIQQFGRSPITTIMDATEQQFLDGSWTITANGTTTAVTFPRLSSNKRIRMLPQNSTARTMLIFGKVMRVVNYPNTGLNTLFEVKGGRWESLDKLIILKRT